MILKILVFAKNMFVMMVHFYILKINHYEISFNTTP